jgi:superkiller protein 3
MDDYKKYLWQAQFEKKTNWLKAITTLRQATDLYPNESELFIELGQLCSERKLHNEAIEYYQKAVEIDPKFTNVYFKIANCYLALKEENLAIYYYDKIAEEFPEALYNKAIALSRQDKTQEVIKVLEQLVAVGPSTSLPYFFLSEQYLTVNEYDKAIKVLRNLEIGFGKQGKVYFLRGLAYSYQKQWLKAYYEFQQCEKMKFETASFYRAYAISADKIGKLDHSLVLLQKAIELEPLNLSVYLDLINIYITHEMIEEAYKVVLHAKDIQPFSSPLSLIYNKLKKMIQAKDSDYEDE